MKLFFGALWCFCFMLIAVIGCDQEMKMMKPAVQDVMDPKPEDKPDTTMVVSQPDAEIPNQTDEPDIAMPPSQPVAEVEQDVEMMEPTVPEPDIEAPPVAVAEMPTEPPDMVEEIMGETDDPYTPLEGFTVFPDKIVIVIRNLHITQHVGGGCLNLAGSFNGVGPTFGFKWQRREDIASSWIDIPETEGPKICGYAPDLSGQYRAVWEVGIDGVLEKYASENILTVE